MKGLIEKYADKLILIAIAIIFGGYLVFSWYNPEKMDDCAYTDTGCQGENNRFGQ